MHINFKVSSYFLASMGFKYNGFFSFQFSDFCAHISMIYKKIKIKPHELLSREQTISPSVADDCTCVSIAKLPFRR